MQNEDALFLKKEVVQLSIRKDGYDRTCTMCTKCESIARTEESMQVHAGTKPKKESFVSKSKDNSRVSCWL
jgi:hypothetical protein